MGLLSAELGRWPASEFARFMAIGTVVAVLQLGSFTLLYDALGLDEFLSGSIAYVAAVVAHFFLNRTVTFAASGKVSPRQVGLYVLLLATNYFVTIVSLLAASDHGIAPQIGMAFALVAAALISFVAMKHVIFVTQA